MTRKPNSPVIQRIVGERCIPFAADALMADGRSDHREGFETQAQASDHAWGHGLFTFFAFNAKTMVKCLALAGFELRYNPVDVDLEVRHQVLTGDLWKPIRKNGNEAAMISLALHQLAVTVRRGKEANGEDEKRFYIAPVPERTWPENGITILDKMRSVIVEDGCGLIPTIHPLKETLEAVRAKIAGWTDEQQEAAKTISREFLLMVPHIVADKDRVAKHASRNIAMGLAQRLIESESPPGYRPRMQREIVMLVSDEHRIGKTATLVSLIPGDLHARVLENFRFRTDDVRMLRSIKGKWLVIADELRGFGAKEGEEWKAFQTNTRPSVDDKFKDVKDFPRTDWVVGSANSVYFTKDPALRSRFFVCEVAANPESKDVEPEQRGREIAAFFEKWRITIIAGGLLMVEAGETIEAPRDLDKDRRLAIESATDEPEFYTALVKKALGRCVNEVERECRLVDVYREMGVLEFQGGLHKGKMIPRFGREDPDNPAPTDEDMAMAYHKAASTKPPQVKKLDGALETLGWQNVRMRRDGTTTRLLMLTDPSGYQPWLEDDE